MERPAEVQLKPGWLEDDVRRAQLRLSEWHGTGQRASALSEPARHAGVVAASRGPEHRQGGGAAKNDRGTP